MSKNGSAGSLAHRLYTGNIRYDFIGNRRKWYTGSAIAVLLSIVSLVAFGLQPSLEFRGGVQYQAIANGNSSEDLAEIVKETSGVEEVRETTARETDGDTVVRLETEEVPDAAVDETAKALAERVGVAPNDITVRTVGSSWGNDITNKAIQGLLLFLVFVLAYLTFRYEWKLALAAIIALMHDLVIAAGIYALTGFEVSPSTVIASLTILGFSLYDTVVVFDKVRENTRNIAGGNRFTYSGAANLALNQTLMRSINTSIIGLLPVAGLLIIGAGLLGAGSLKDLSLPLLIGLAIGTYSSIFVAVPLACDFKEREPAMKQLARRVNGTPARSELAGVAASTKGAPSTAKGSGATVVRPSDRPVTSSRRKPPGARPGQKRK